MPGHYQKTVVSSCFRGIEMEHLLDYITVIISMW